MLGTVLDGIPESFVLGSSLLQEGAVPTAVVVGVFVSNVPEALSGSAGLLRPAGRAMRVFRMWTYVVAASVSRPFSATRCSTRWGRPAARS